MNSVCLGGVSATLRLGAALGIATCFTSVVAISPCAADGKLAAKSDSLLLRQSAEIGPNERVKVIVQLNGGLTLDSESRLKDLGADIYRRLPIIHSVAISVPVKSLRKLSSLPFVTRLSSDAPVIKNDEFTVEGSGADTAFGRYGLTGAGVGIAIVDSGVRPGQDLMASGNGGGSRLSFSANFVPGATGINDNCGHGTHVAGIAAGDGSASSGPNAFRTFYGIARKANIISVRVLNSNGQSDVSTVISGIQWSITNKAKYNIRVMNLSLGHPVTESYTTDPLCQAVEQAWKSGIVVVCAAGNNGRRQDMTGSDPDNDGYGTNYGSIQSPGNDPYVITVGAMKRTSTMRSADKIATYSSRGPSRLDFVMKPDIVAPGNQIISLDANASTLDNAYGGTNQIPWSAYMTRGGAGSTPQYFRLSGTSMAAPVVSGAAALMLEANSGLSPDTVKARLMHSADKWTLPGGDSDPCTFGAGYLNIPAALASKVTATRSAMSPALVNDNEGGVFINMDRAVWGTGGLWGTGIQDLRAVWGTKAIWGNSTNLLDASRAMWGQSVWFDRAVWGTSSSSVDLSNIAIKGE